MRLRRETAALPIPPCYHPSSSFQREELQYSLEFDLRCHPECTICCIVLKYVLLREEKYFRAADDSTTTVSSTGEGSGKVLTIKCCIGSVHSNRKHRPESSASASTEIMASQIRIHAQRFLLVGTSGLTALTGYKSQSDPVHFFWVSEYNMPIHASFVHLHYFE